MRLYELASLIRSKNAGPFTLTIDVMFADPAGYARVRDNGLLSPQNMARLYGVPQERITVHNYDPAQAIKVSMPRPAASGSREDHDVYGGQFHGPLVLLAVP
ncbi:DUF4387 domain-containing protein [Georgenia sp. 10Sc9-8]|uniref:DUF4387 domain-containing protein n=1 Tax=Georgenia halotolerans TaxID=3028317 RepID=A0ABT5U1N3_9MICO|nr:DUF4387 domain-containing protein [Georgenia halotolerans]